MHSRNIPVSNDRKRKLSVGSVHETVPSPPAKRRKRENEQRHQTPSSFWDNLSRLWLNRRALREFDRRTAWPTAPIPPQQPRKENIQLTQLKRFARRGGPSLGDLRAYPEPESAVLSNKKMAASQSGPRKRQKSGEEPDIPSKTRKSSAYDPAFQQHLIDHGVYPNGHGGFRNAQEPSNLEEIHARLALPRASLSLSRFTREMFLDFTQKNEDALTEGRVMSKAFPIIAGTANIPSQENLPFGNFEDLTDGSIIKGQPDFYDGSRPIDLEKRIRKELGSYIVPSTNKTAPCLPNFFAEGKGPKGSVPVGKNQVLYDGALGARAIHELRSYVDQETAYDNNAYTFTSTYYHSGLLTLYTTHPTQSGSPIKPIEYHMTQLRSFAMTDNADTFRQGASALRNARDWANEKRQEFIAGANSKALNADCLGLDSSTQSFMSLPSDEPTYPESASSADELASGHETITSSIHRTPARTRTNPPPRGTSKPRSKKMSQVNKRPSRKPDGKSGGKSGGKPGRRPEA